MSLCHRLFLKAAQRSGGEGVCLEESSKSANTKLQRSTKFQTSNQASTVKLQSIIVLERTRIFAWQEILCVAAARLCELRAHSEGNLAVRLWLQDGWRSELGVRSLRLYTLIYGYFAYLRMACGRGRGTRICEPEKWAVRLCSDMLAYARISVGREEKVRASSPRLLRLEGSGPLGQRALPFGIFATCWRNRNKLG